MHSWYMKMWHSLQAANQTYVEGVWDTGEKGVLADLRHCVDN